MSSNLRDWKHLYGKGSGRVTAFSFPLFLVSSFYFCMANSQSMWLVDLFLLLFFLLHILSPSFSQRILCQIINVCFADVWRKFFCVALFHWKYTFYLPKTAYDLRVIKTNILPLLLDKRHRSYDTHSDMDLLNSEIKEMKHQRHRNTNNKKFKIIMAVSPYTETVSLYELQYGG